jgi:hypothetical protein
MVSDISEARYRQKAGQPLEPRHIEAVKEHDRKYARNKVSVHVAQWIIDEWKVDAARTGDSLSEFVSSRVQRTRSPDPVIEQLREEKAKLQAELEACTR